MAEVSHNRFISRLSVRLLLYAAVVFIFSRYVLIALVICRSQLVAISETSKQVVIHLVHFDFWHKYEIFFFFLNLVVPKQE